jgi:hypothetical protein
VVEFAPLDRFADQSIDDGLLRLERTHEEHPTGFGTADMLSDACGRQEGKS